MDTDQPVFPSMRPAPCPLVCGYSEDRVGTYVRACIRPAGHPGECRTEWEVVAWKPTAETVKVVGDRL